MIPGIPFRNDSPATAPGFAVLRAVGVVEVDGQAVLRVDQPNGTFERLYYINGPLPVAPGEYGVCAAGAPAFVLRDGEAGEPLAGQSWGAAGGTWALVPRRPGFTILGAPLGQGGTARVLVRQQEITTLLGYLDEALWPGSSATVSIWAGAAGSEEDSGQDVAAGDWLLREADEPLAAGTRVVVQWIHGAWYVTEAQCPA